MTAVELSEKRCPRCDTTLPTSQFYATKNGKLSGWCKPCTIEAAKARQEQTAATEEGRELLRARRRQSYARHGRSPADYAWKAATKALIELHKREFDALYQREMYERTAGKK
jgi:recombinational DNA repair protein (RecF pathway)